MRRRVAAISDIHGNLPALDAVLQDIRRVGAEEIVVCGDVLPGPMASGCIACLQQSGIPTRFIHGNGDREVIALLSGKETEWYRTAPEPWREPVRWAAQQLSPEHRTFLDGWPSTCSIRIEGMGKVLFCHATPRNDTDIFTRLTVDGRLSTAFQGVDAPIVICGHTHMRFDRKLGAIRIVNAGSVGMPFGEPGAYWVLLGPDIQLRRTEYDTNAAAEQIRRTAYPQAADFAAHNVLDPPSQEKMLEIFAKAEVK